MSPLCVGRKQEFKGGSFGKFSLGLHSLPQNFAATQTEGMSFQKKRVVVLDGVAIRAVACAPSGLLPVRGDLIHGGNPAANRRRPIRGYHVLVA